MRKTTNAIPAGRSHAENARALAREVRKQAKGASHVLVGPALIYRNEELGLMVAVGTPGRPGRLMGLDFGPYEDDPEDNALCQAADTVIWARQPGGITKREGEEARQEFIRDLGRTFRVEAHDSDLALAEAYARLFPSPEARRLLAAVRAEGAA
jgi:hypothetical protein